LIFVSALLLIIEWRFILKYS